MSHGHCANESRSPTYNSWRSMLARCYSRGHNQFHNYGGRGIRVCPRWHEFTEFLADMGEAPPGMSLDRVDCNGDYCPANCRWSTEQAQQNNRRGNRILEVAGRSQTLADWGRESGISDHTILDRLTRGWSAEKAVTTPSRKYERAKSGMENRK